jgi:hypothetical protein
MPTSIRAVLEPLAVLPEAGKQNARAFSVCAPVMV